MKYIKTSLPDVIVVEPRVFRDDRGFFLESWHKLKFKENNIDVDFVQDNHSRSSKSILRGLHYQITQPQGKLVRVISGEVYDVAVDIRKSSPTFGMWTGEYLSSENHKMLWVPEGFAHGFLVTSDDAEVIYKCTDYYEPTSECSIRWDDPDLNIEWPIPENQGPLLSDKDSNGTSLKDAVLFP
jgi:dTDP-4-dehydrorhamnose 3,5-epimerase